MFKHKGKLEERPEDERSFSFKNATDRNLFFIILGIILTVCLIIGVLVFVIISFM